MLLGAAGLLAALLAPAWGAEAYPTRSVRLIVPFPPGQAADIFARLLAQRLSTTWGQQVVVDNRGGGAGVPAMLAAKAAAPDGHTMIMATTGTLSITPFLYAKPPYDPLKDFVPVTNVVVAPLVFTVHPSVPYRSISDLVAAAKKEPGKLMYASPGQGTSQHLTAELFAARAGIKLVHIPYKGSGPAVADLVGGQVLLMMDSVPSALPHVRSGRIRAIAVTTAQRTPQLPDVPTIAESGYPGFEGTGWAGILVPAGTPLTTVQRMSDDIREALNEPKLRGDIIARGGIPDPRPPKAYEDFIRSETEKWARVAKEAQVQLEP
jgi:tripartite-type tricarboxylate transporter receptor subunit TctC